MFDADAFAILHVALLLGFLGVTSLLMLMTVTNRLRLRRVLLSWRTGRAFGLPLLPLGFILLILGLLGYALLTGRSLMPVMFTGYLVGGVFWFVSALLASTIVVSDYGLILNVNYAERVVAWGQVTDYFACDRDNACSFVFFYVNGSGARQRLELTVPPAQREAFKQVVGSKLDARFDFSVQQAYGKKALER